MIKSLTLYLRRHPALLVGLLASLMFLPWLGLPLFNTKGEPREAIVAVSMLQSGDWVLPVSFGGDIPYKPPFLAWCIALLSWLAGGVSEYTSRLSPPFSPSHASRCGVPRRRAVSTWCSPFLWRQPRWL